MLNKCDARQAGFSLLEVLVAVLVLSFGLLGLGALQANALKNNQSSFERSQAVMLSYFITDAIRADRANAVSYSMGETCSEIADPPKDEPALDAIGQTKQKWMSALQKNLAPGACGKISCVANGTTPETYACAITVSWSDDRGTGKGSRTGSANAEKVVLETKTRL